MAHAPAPGQDRVAYNRSVYDNVWNWVYRGYYDANFNGVDWRAAGERHRAAAAAAADDSALYAAINALLDELKDRHTHAAYAQEFASLFRHINAVIGLRTEAVREVSDGRRRVIEVLPGAPAAAAGIQVGWWLLTCDHRPPTEVLGPGKLHDGQVVHCEFLKDDGARYAVDLTARRLSFPPFRSAREVDDHVLVLRFDSFDMPSAQWLREQLLFHSGKKAVVLDLRGNTGGHIFALAAVLGDVFSSPVSMGEMIHRGQPSRWHRSISQRGGAHYVGPLAVVVSHDTASAAEIFAQLIQDYERGKVVGTRTAGAMLTSVFWPLAGGGKLQLSVYDYRSPKGRRLEGNGVVPDVLVEAPAEKARLGPDDRAVKAAVEALRPSLPK